MWDQLLDVNYMETVTRFIGLLWVYTG